MGGGGSRQGPARLWHDCRAPGCHFVTVAVVAVGGEVESGVLRHCPDGLWRGGGLGSWLQGPPVVLCSPLWASTPRPRPEALLERRSTRRATILFRALPTTHTQSGSLSPALFSGISLFLLQAF